MLLDNLGTWTGGTKIRADWKLGSHGTRTTGRQRDEQAYVLKGGGEQKATLNSTVLFAEDIRFLTKLEDNQLKKPNQNKPPQTKPAVFSIFIGIFTDSCTTNTTSNDLVSAQHEGSGSTRCHPPFPVHGAVPRTESCSTSSSPPSQSSFFLPTVPPTADRQTRLSTADRGTVPGVRQEHQRGEER